MKIIKIFKDITSLILGIIAFGLVWFGLSFLYATEVNSKQEKLAEEG